MPKSEQKGAKVCALEEAREKVEASTKELELIRYELPKWTEEVVSTYPTSSEFEGGANFTTKI